MNGPSEVAYCGERCRVQQRAAALIEEMIVGEYDEWGHALEGFTTFWEFLHRLADVSVPKRCCKETCGIPECGRRECAKRRGIDACPLCDDYPCDKIQAFANGTPTMLFDDRRLKAIGMQAWIAEQEARRQNGFCYSDVRCSFDIGPE